MEVIAKITKADWVIKDDRMVLVVTFFNSIFTTNIEWPNKAMNFMKSLNVKSTQNLIGKNVILRQENDIISYVRPFDESKVFIGTIEWEKENIHGFIFLYDNNNKPLDYASLMSVISILNAPFENVNVGYDIVEKELTESVIDSLDSDDLRYNDDWD